MPVAYDFDRINDRFVHAVTLLQDNLQYLADQGKVSDKFVAMQNEIINCLVDYHHETEHYISGLEMENMELASGRLKQITRLRDEKVCLEAVCFIHGVMDLPAWMVKGKRYLISETIKNNRQHTIQLPSRLTSYINEMDPTDREIMMRLLWKKYDENRKHDITAKEYQEVR
ncbi:MAG: hypothetical protein KDD36_04370 [Flavobacteriales bacterium]|nr:hypothetical protein [Flavobacteriales bacterium]